MNTLQLMQSTGFKLPTPAYLFGAILFGVLGLVAWREGRRRERPVTQWLGVALMFYPYFTSSTALLYGAGLVLSAAAWRAAR